MNKVVIGCAIALGICVLLIAVGGYVAYRYIVLPLGSSGMEMPEALAIPRTVLRSESVTKGEFYADARLGTITHIVHDELDGEPGLEIGIAGSRGAVFLDDNLDVKSSVTFDARAGIVEFIDVDADGVCEFVDRGGGWQDVSLFDHAGNTTWTYGGGPSPNDMCGADADGDGEFEFVVGFNGGGGVRLLNGDGEEQWRQPDGNVWHVEFVDTDGDGKLEIVHSNAAGQLTVRDRQGNIVSRVKAGSYFSGFSICSWPTKSDKKYALVAEDGAVSLFDFDGTRIKEYSAPDSSASGDARGTPVKIGPDGRHWFAVIVNLDVWERSLLYLYDSEGNLEYQEILPEAAASISAIALDSPDKESLLIGGDGRVWKYTIEHGQRGENP